MLPLAKSQLEKYKKGWINSFCNSFSQDESGNPLPWMTYPFIEFISDKLDKNHKIFEFGFGASTLFFAKKVTKVVAIESNAMWFKMMQIKLKDQSIKNIDIILMEDALLNPNYEKSVADYNEKFDFIFIDSLKRFECAKNSITALKKEGMLILDDSQRKGYKKIFNFFEEQGFKKQDFVGIAPGQLKLKNTTVFTKI
jgi:predicted O-methyltransferase YrrM